MLHYDRITPQILSAMCNICDVGIMLLSKERGIVFWNKWLEDASGIENKDILGKSLNEAFSGFENERITQAINDVFSHRLPAIMSPRLHANVFPLTSSKNITAQAYVKMEQLITLNPLITETGQVYCIIQITDVSAAISRENTLRQQAAALSLKTAELESALQSEKLFTSLQRKFVSVVSHEFRTPLAIIDGVSQRLIRNKATISPEGINERCGVIRRAIKRVTGLMDVTLYASRIDEGEIELSMDACDIKEMVQEICDRQLELTPSHTIKCDLSGLPSKVYGDDKLLNLIYTNLLSNAVKYAPKAPVIEVKGWCHEGMAIVSVKDYGIGIAEDDMPNMFGRFFRAKTAEGISGTGIGLNICKEFIELHGGTIELESVEGEGSTFTVHIPIGL